jgi:hypothetical protein
VRWRKRWVEKGREENGTMVLNEKGGLFPFVEMHSFWSEAFVKAKKVHQCCVGMDMNSLFDMIVNNDKWFL